MLVSVPELQKYMSGLNLTQDQQMNAAAVLSGVQQELETYLNRPVELVQIREVLMSDESGYINVSVSPIHKVLRADILDPVAPLLAPMFPTYTVDPQVRDALIGDDGRMLDHFYPAVGDPMIVPGGIYIGNGMTYYAVEYIGGYNGYVDDALKLAIMRVTAREVTRSSDDTLSLREGNAEQAADPDPRQTGWTDSELRAFDRLRRRVVV